MTATRTHEESYGGHAPDTAPNAGKVHVFISHSSRDKYVATQLAQLFALILGENQIRCTSDPKFGMDAGVPFAGTLAREAVTAPVFVCLISSAFVNSSYAMFETGARWAKKHEKPNVLLIPILLYGHKKDKIPAPIDPLLAVNAGSDVELKRFVDKYLEKDCGPKAESIIQTIARRNRGFAAGVARIKAVAPRVAITAAIACMAGGGAWLLVQPQLPSQDGVELCLGGVSQLLNGYAKVSMGEATLRKAVSRDLAPCERLLLELRKVE